MPVPQDYYILDLLKRFGLGGAPAEPTQGAPSVDSGVSAVAPPANARNIDPYTDLFNLITGRRREVPAIPSMDARSESRGLASESPLMDPPVGGVSPARELAPPQVPQPTARPNNTIRDGAKLSKSISAPAPPSEGGALRFSVGGKWYERAPGASGGTFETTPRQTDRGMAFDRGGMAFPEDMSAVRERVRSQGAFGSTTPLGPDRGPGGFSPSPRVEDVAVMPESVLEEQDKKRIASELARVNADMAIIPDNELPAELERLKGLGLSRGEYRSYLAGMLTAKEGSDKQNALPMLNAIDTQWRAEVKKVREDPNLTPEQKAENESILTQNMLDARKQLHFDAPQGML